MTALTRSSTTCGPVLAPIDLISSSCFCVSLSACSSAALLPEVCYIITRKYWRGRRCMDWGVGRMYLLLERLELVLLLLAVVFDFLLRFAAGVFYSFCSVCISRLSLGLNDIAIHQRRLGARIHSLAFWTIFCASLSACTPVNGSVRPRICGW